MATSAITFESTFTLSSPYSTGECALLFRPPSNISGKLCYIEVKIFQMMWGTTYNTPDATHTYILRASGWTQPYSARVQGSGSQQVNGPLATLCYGQNATGLPILAFIPDGPHTVTFKVERLDLGTIGTALTDLDFIICMTIVPANGRQTPLT